MNRRAQTVVLHKLAEWLGEIELGPRGGNHDRSLEIIANTHTTRRRRDFGTVRRTFWVRLKDDLPKRRTVGYDTDLFVAIYQALEEE